MNDWNIDLAALYGDGPRGYAHEDLFESPDGRHAVVMYGIDEVGVNKEAGRVAVFRNKAAPELVFRPKLVAFWYAGTGTAEFDPTGRFVTLHEFRSQTLGGGWPPPRTRTIDLERGAFTTAPPSSRSS